MSIRSINIDSADGVFQGNFTVMLNNTDAMNSLIKKIKAVKGVKQVSRQQFNYELGRINYEL